MPDLFAAAAVYLLLPFLLLILLTAAVGRKRSATEIKLPPSPPKLPLIGNLHQLSPLLHRSLAALAKVHGPIMLVHLGRLPVIFITSADLANEALRVQDPVFASRPPYSKATEIILYGKDLGFMPYGAYWRWAKKIFSLHLLSTKRVRSYDPAREEGVTRMVEAIKADQSLNGIVDASKILFAYSHDFICRVVSGNDTRDEKRNEEFRKLLGELSAVLLQSGVQEALPEWIVSLGEFLGLTRTLKMVKEQHRKWDALLEELLEQKNKTSKEEGANDDEEEGFADVLLRLKEKGVEGDEGFVLGNDNVKALLLDVFSAGTESTYSTLEWAILEILKNPPVKIRLQDELRNEAKKFGYNQNILRASELRLMSLPYLNAVIKETLRLHPSTPLLLPKVTIQDCMLGGYNIPKGSRVMINAWAIARDPNYWEAPEKFNPNRFMGSTIDFRGNDSHLIPFGAGRRMCPGMLLATSTIELALANLMFSFDLELPPSMDVDALDMTEEPGVTIRRKKKLELIATTMTE